VFSPDEVELLLWLVAAAAERQVIWVLGNHEHPLQKAMDSDVLRTIKGGAPRLRIGRHYIHQTRDGKRWRSSTGMPGARLGPLAAVGPLGLQILVMLDAGAAAWGCPVPPWRCSRGDEDNR